MRNSCPYCEMLEREEPLSGMGLSDEEWVTWKNEHNKNHTKLNQEISEEGK